PHTPADAVGCRHRPDFRRLAGRPPLPLHPRARTGHSLAQGRSQLGRRREGGDRRKTISDAMTARIGRALAALLLWISAATPAPARAQGVTAHVSGVVLDSGGGVVPSATVTITNAETTWHREAVTGTEGRFVFVDVLAGTYGVSATRDGFKRVERKDV